MVGGSRAATGARRRRGPAWTASTPGRPRGPRPTRPTCSPSAPCRCCTSRPARCPATVGDFGSGAVEALGPEDVFVALVEYGSDLADTGLFEKQGVPRLAPSQFGPHRMPRDIVGRSASQHFFSVGGRAFCLFTVLGSHSRRMATVPRAAAVARSLQIVPAATMHAPGGERVSTTATTRPTPWPSVVERPTGLVRLVDRLSRRGGVSRRGAARRRRGGRLGPGHRPQGVRPAAADGLRHDLRPGQHGLERLDDLLRHGQQGRQRLPARQLHGRLVEGRRLVVVRRWLPLHRRLQRQVHEVHDRLLRPHLRQQVLELLVHAPGRRRRATSAQDCCNAFRYGQCNTQVKCSGGVHCRVVSLRGAVQVGQLLHHLVPQRRHRRAQLALPARRGARWSSSYTAMGGQRSYLKASTGPIRPSATAAASTSTTRGPHLVDARRPAPRR